MSKHLFCRDVCLERGEPLAGTGNMAERFIFVRWPRGKWRVPRFESADMGPALSRAVQGAMKQGIHVALVDRVGETNTLPMLQANGVVADFESEDVRLNAALRTTSRDEAELMLWEVESLLCCGPAGGGGFRGVITPAVMTKSLLIDRNLVKPTIEMFVA